MSNKQRKGFTLVEIAIVLGIIGVILGAVWAAAGSAYLGANANRFQQQIGQYLVAVRAYCGAGGTCTSGTVIPTLSVAPPTLGLATVDVGGNVPQFTGNGFSVQWKIPTSQRNTCISMGNGINAISGATVADTIAHADGYLVPAASTACVGAGATPTCPANTATVQYTPVASSCTSAVATSGFCTMSLIPSGFCGATAQTLAAAFTTTY